MILKSYSYTPFKADGKQMFGNTPEESWSALYKADADGSCSWALRSLFVDDGLNRVLIDTGFNGYNPAILSEYKIVNFKSAGEIIDKNINVVIHTHLHLDHCGGSFISTKEGFKPTFSNSYYYVADRQLNIAKNPSEFEKDSFQSEIITAFNQYNNLRLISGNINLFPWLQLRLFNGHTNGLMIPVIHLAQYTIVFIGDLVPSMAHLALNSISGYDIDPKLSASERNEFLKEVYENNYILFFQHDIKYECCTLNYDGKNYQPLKTFSLSDLS